MSLFTPRVEKRSDDWTDWEAGGSRPGSSCSPTHLVPFFAAIRHIVDYLSTLPVDGSRIDGDGRSPMSSLPPLFRRLNEPGDIGIGNWIGQWAYGVAVHGNAVGWITTIDGFGFPASIRWLRDIDWDFDESSKQWYVYGIPANPSRLVHSPWIVPVGCTLGLSPVEHFKTFWDAGRSAQEYADVSRGGGIPPTTLRNTVLTELDAASARAIQRQATRAFATGGPFVSGKDWDLKVNAIPANQANFLKTLELTANSTAGIFGIDPREIGGTGADGTITYATDESRSLNRANDMRPYIERFEAMVSRILPAQQYVKLNVDATIRTDIKTRTEVIGMKLADGRMSVNEARALEDEPPLPPDTMGDYYNVPGPGVPRAVPSGL